MKRVIRLVLFNLLIITNISIHAFEKENSYLSNKELDGILSIFTKNNLSHKRSVLFEETNETKTDTFEMDTQKNIKPYPNQKRAIVVGASIGMGYEVAKLLAKDGYTVGLVARRTNLLEKLQQEIPTKTYVQYMDVGKLDDAVKKFENLIQEMGGLDLLVLSITGFYEVDWDDRSLWADKAVFDVDILGFYALARTALNLFEKQGHGHLVGFSSVDGLRGIAGCPLYSAAKAFCSRYMEAERNRFIQKNLPITITDIIPGWVNSKEDPNFQKDHPKAYWIDSLKDASNEIFQAIKNKQSIAYITKRWEKVADVIKIMSDDLYNALGGL